MKRRRKSDSLSLGQARRIAIKAQRADLGAARGVANRADLRKLFDRLGVLQIDSVNVLARAHTLPAFSRLGNYDLADLDYLAYGGKRRKLFEYWGHAASLMPVQMQPLFRWRMKEAEEGKRIYAGLSRFAKSKKSLVAWTFRPADLASGPGRIPVRCPY